MIKSRTYIKSRFESGDCPTQQDFIDLVDSYFHQTEDNVLQGTPGADNSVTRWNADGDLKGSLTLIDNSGNITTTGNITLTGVGASFRIGANALGAQHILFTPGDLTDWGSPDPTLVDSALDELADRLTIVEVTAGELSKISANDTTAGYLEDKIVGVANKITISTLNDGGDEDLQITIGSDIFDKTVDDGTDITYNVVSPNYWGFPEPTNVSEALDDADNRINDLDPINHNHHVGVNGSMPTITSGEGGDAGKVIVESANVWFFTDDTKREMTLITMTGDTYMAVNDDTTGYVCADKIAEDWVILYSIDSIDYLRYVPFYIVYKINGNNYVHLQEITLYSGSEISNNNYRLLTSVDRYSIEPGAFESMSVVNSSPGGLQLTVSGGKVWGGNTRHDIDPVTTATRQFSCENLGGSWDCVSAIGPLLNNTQWNSIGSPAGYVTMTNTYWSSMYIWRGIEDQDHIYTVQDSAEYATLVLAQAANQVPAIPSLISSHAMLLGRVIFEKGATSDFVIESAFETIFAASSSVSDHGSLAGLADNDHSQYQLTSQKGSANGYCGLDASAEVALANLPTHNNFSGLDGGGGSPEVYNHLTAQEYLDLQTTQSILNFWNGTFEETFDATLTSDGATITMSLEKSGGGDLTMNFSDGQTILDCTPAKTIALTAGTMASPQSNYIYILKSTKVLTKSTTQWPSAEHIKVAYFFVQTAAYVQEDGALINQNWNDHFNSTDLQGHLSHITEWIRTSNSIYFSGIAGTGGDDYTTSAAGSVTVQVGAGIVYQLHKHVFQAKDTGASPADDIHIVNAHAGDGGAYFATENLYDITVDTTGATLTNKWFNVVLWGVINKSGEYSPLMANIPTGSYINQANAENDVNGYDVFSIPREFNRESSTGFLIARLTFRKTGGSWTYASTVDLRGLTPSTATGGTPGGGDTEFSDSTFRIFNNTDPTKIISYDLSGITTGNTRIITVPDKNITLFAQELKTKAITIESPTSSEDITMFFTDRAITIVEMEAVLANGSLTPSVTWKIFHHTDRSNAGNAVVTAGTTTTSATTGSIVTVFNDATVPANSWVWIETTAKSGTVPELHISIQYNED